MASLNPESLRTVLELAGSESLETYLEGSDRSRAGVYDEVSAVEAFSCVQVVEGLDGEPRLTEEGRTFLSELRLSLSGLS